MAMQGNEHTQKRMNASAIPHCTNASIAVFTTADDVSGIAIFAELNVLWSAATSTLPRTCRGPNSLSDAFHAFIHRQLLIKTC